MRRLAPLLGALALLAPAGGQEPARHDLRARRAPRAGDEVRVVERERMRQRYRLERDGQVLDEGQESQGSEQRYVRRVEEVEDGAVRVELRRYEAVSALGEPAEEERYEQPVELRLALRDKRWTYAPAGDAGQPIPKLLRRALDAETQGTVESRPAEDAPYLQLFPERPVAVGEEWDVPPTRLAEVLSFEARHVARASRARGKLKAADVTDGAKLLEVELTFTLELTHVLQERVPQPAKLSGKIELGMSPDGPRRYARAQAVLEYQGPCPGKAAPPGSLLKLRVEIDNTDERTPPPARPEGPARPPGR